MTGPRRCRRIVAAVAIGVVCVACGSGEDPGGSGDPTTTGDASGDAIVVADFTFTPQSRTVPVGAEVAWVNDGEVVHTVTADDGSFDSGQLDPDADYRFAFNDEGIFAYHCENHPDQMKGIITVAS